MADIQEAEDRALAACDASFAQRLAQMGAVIENGQVTDRSGLIAFLGDIGEPETTMANGSDQDLATAAAQRVLSLYSTCNTDAYQQTTEAYQAISETMRDNITALRSETASLQDLLAVLEQLEALADDDASIQLQIEELRQSIAEAQQETARFRHETARLRQETAEYAAQSECLFHSIVTDNTEPDCSDPTVFGEFLER